MHSIVNINVFKKKGKIIMENKIIRRAPLGNPRRFWRQNRFVLSTFSLRSDDVRKAINTLVEAGFNLAEFGWCSHKQAEEGLRLAEEAGLDVLFQDFTVFGGMQENYLKRRIGPEVAAQMADKLRRYKHCIGTYNWDEPYVKNQLTEARRQIDLFRRELPERLPFTVAIPSYNRLYTWENDKFAGYLERYVTALDPEVLSLDYYPIGLHDYTPEKQLDDSYMWCDLGLMRKLCAKYSLPLWFYYQGVDLYDSKVFNYTQTRMMMYAACLYGAKGLQQYTALDAVFLADGSKGPYFEEQKQLNREFCYLGPTLMALNSQYVFHSDDLLPGDPHHAGLYDDIAESAFLAAPLPKRVSAGELTDAEGNVYLLVLNRDYDRDIRISLPLKKTARVYRVDRTDGYQYMTDDRTDVLNLELTKGDAVLLRLQDANDAPFTLEYRLEK